MKMPFNAKGKRTQRRKTNCLCHFPLRYSRRAEFPRGPNVRDSQELVPPILVPTPPA